MPMHALDQAHQLELFETARDTAIDHAPPTEPPTAFTPTTARRRDGHILDVDVDDEVTPGDRLLMVGQFWEGQKHYRLWLEQI